MLVILPNEAKLDDVMLDDGLLKFAWLKALNASARNSSFHASWIANVLNTLRSTVCIPGPAKARGATLPNVPSVGAANAAALRKYPVALLPA